MRAVVGVVVASCLAAGCTKKNYFECTTSPDCDFLVGGTCIENPATGTSWCAAPDGTCPSGYRWDSSAVGDDVEGVCTPDTESCTARIAWVKNDGSGEQDLYVMNPDGSQQRNLSMDPDSVDDAPSWAPTGDKLAFRRDLQLWIVNADGTEPRMLAASASDYVPRWSADGARIMFTRAGQIWVVDVDSGEETAITQDSTVSHAYPQWSPDEALISFKHDNDIYVIDADGSDKRNLTTDGMISQSDWIGQWSPDSQAIAYISSSSGDQEVWSVRVSGGAPINLSQSPATIDGMGEGGDVRWSPEGDSLYFTRTVTTPTTSMELFRMGADGSAQTGLGLMRYYEDQGSSDSHLAISASGDQVAFGGYADDTPELFVGDLTAGTRTQVTEDVDTEFAMAWSPCP